MKFMPEEIRSDSLAEAPEKVADGSDTLVKVDESGKEAVRLTFSSLMGTEFKTYEDAVKSMTETKNFVGSVGRFREAAQKTAERLGTDVTGVLKLMDNIQPNPAAPNGEQAVPNPQAPAAAPSNAAQGNEAGAEALRIAQDSARRVERLEFFSARPELSDYRDVIIDQQEQTGRTLKEVVENPNFKTVLEKARENDEAKRSLSVMHSNPGITAARDKMSEAKEALSRNDHEGANAAAVGAVIDTFSK